MSKANNPIHSARESRTFRIHWIHTFVTESNGFSSFKIRKKIGSENFEIRNYLSLKNLNQIETKKV